MTVERISTKIYYHKVYVAKCVNQQNVHVYDNVTQFWITTEKASTLTHDNDRETFLLLIVVTLPRTLRLVYW